MCVPQAFPEVPTHRSRRAKASRSVTLRQSRHSSLVSSHTFEQASHFQVSAESLGCPISQAVSSLRLFQRAKLRMRDRGLPLPSESVRIQHLQQQVIHWHHVFTLHAEEMLHPLVTVKEDKSQVSDLGPIMQRRKTLLEGAPSLSGGAAPVPAITYHRPQSPRCSKVESFTI